MSERFLDQLSKIISTQMSEMTEVISGIDSRLEEQNKHLETIAKSLKEIAPFKTEEKKAKKK